MGYRLDFGLFLTNESYEILINDDKIKEFLSNMEYKKTITTGTIFSHTWLKAFYLEESDLEKKLKNLDVNKNEFCFMIYIGEEYGDHEIYTNYTQKEYESEYPYMWKQTQIMVSFKDTEDQSIYNITEEIV